MNPIAIKRLLAPRTLALFGGDWADAVAAASRAIGYAGEVWRVHPKRPSTESMRYFRSVEELPGAPDAAFIAAPAHEVPGIAAHLARREAGGFVCFAAGFSETGTPRGQDLTAQLVRKAGALPYFGPNCYGFLNFFDRAALWPDQVVGGPVERGVAIICQSGTLGLNLLFSDRSVPIGYLITVGNQTCLAVEDMIELLSADDRVTAFGLYVEGVKDAARFAQAVAKAREAGKAVALVKAGRTEAAARTVHTHTGSLAGADSVFDSFCRQSGIARCETLAALCETLKVFHTGGPLRGRRVLVMGASGGDMAMAADSARHLGLKFPPFDAGTARRLREILSDRVTLSNPFDFHTHVWFDRPALRAMFSAVHGAGFDATGLVIDCPPERGADPAAYLAVIEEYLAAFPGPPARPAVISSLPESMAPATRQRCLQSGAIPLQGQREALEALDLAGSVGEAWAAGCAVRLLRPPAGATGAVRTLSESEGKAALSSHGVRIPRSQVVAAQLAPDAAQRIGFPVVLKATGAHLEHKSDVGAVMVNLRSRDEVQAATQRLAGLSQELLVEEMIIGGVAEILVGLTLDPQFGQALVLGAGGVHTELLRDSVTLLPPFSAGSIEAGLRRLKVWRVLAGYRGRPAADVAALVETALACASYAASNITRLVELDVNPVIVRAAGQGAVAVDALIRLASGDLTCQN